MPRRVLLVTYSLELGGTQRATVFLAETFAAAGWEVGIFLCADRPIHFTLPSAVEVIRGWETRWRPKALGLPGRSAAQALALSRLIRRLPADVVVALGNTPALLALAASLGSSVPVIVSDRVAPSRDPLERGPLRLAVRLLYPRAARVVCVSQGIATERAWLPEGKVVVVPNAVALDGPTPSAPPAPAIPDVPRVVGLGRLHAQKGFDLLIEAFARIAPDFPAWNLAILGEGPQRDALEARAAELGLSSRLELVGAVSNPAPALRSAAAAGSVFAFPSRYEGFPFALVEAMACGLPVVATDCPHGPREILAGGQHGLLVPPEDPTALAAALTTLLSDEDRRRDYAARAAARAQHYRPDRIGPLWLGILEEAVARRAGTGRCCAARERVRG